jgi:RNA polymerase sigma-70 factor (ECF subfamily)
MVLTSDDKHLLKRLRAGDKDALRRIYEKYIDDLLRVALSILCDIQRAEDCLHDVFVDLAGAADGLRIRSNLRSYLVSSVANRARDQLRKRTRQSAALAKKVCGQPISGNPLRQIVDSEESARVLRALAALPYEQREAFVLHVQGELKFREIAGQLGVSMNSVQSRYRYAIEKLRAILDEEPE